MIFTHSGNAGDIIFSLPTITHLCNGEKKAVLYVKAKKYVYGNQCDFVKDFLLLQPAIKEVIPFTPSDNNWHFFNWPGLKFDYDLDIARNQGQRGRIHIIKRYFDAFGIKKEHTRPFLTVDDRPSLKPEEKFALIHLTPRWNGLQYDWGRIYQQAKERHGSVYFVGFEAEWLDFCLRFGQIENIHTENLLDIARLIRDCEALYCGQGVCLTIAQGLGKEYWLVKNGTKTNCHLFTENEHLIGAEMLAPYHTFSELEKPDSHLKQR